MSNSRAGTVLDIDHLAAANQAKVISRKAVAHQPLDARHGIPSRRAKDAHVPANHLVRRDAEQDASLLVGSKDHAIVIEDQHRVWGELCGHYTLEAGPRDRRP